MPTKYKTNTHLSIKFPNDFFPSVLQQTCKDSQYPQIKWNKIFSIIPLVTRLKIKQWKYYIEKFQSLMKIQFQNVWQPKLAGSEDN